eukprot:TRINITY_DN1299_c2_g4_i1.p1 TRINITY_DN1299_c2_g4~~TRINITY_DN1299_c2_g4_i1.p1  ORF type:complete len:270 (-),score=106.70 TRINITY_DN1299_c2_g4_i1:206-1015(-)
MARQEIDLEWKGLSAGGRPNLSSWRNNPQVFFTTHICQKVKVTLYQEARFHFAIAFFITEAFQRAVRQLTLQDALIKPSSFEEVQQYQQEFEFPSGTYVIIPCTWDQNEECKFKIIIESEEPVEVEGIDEQKNWKVVILEGCWQEKTAGGCVNFPTFVKNPQYLLFSSTAAKIYILLVQKPPKKSEVGLYIFETRSRDLNGLVGLTRKDVVVKTEFESKNETICELQTVKDKMYTVVPCCYDHGIEGEFQIYVFCLPNDDVKLGVIPIN